MRIRTNEEIYRYLDRIYAIPQKHRNITYEELSSESGIDRRYLYLIRQKRIKLSRRLRYQLSVAMERLGEPQQVLNGNRRVRTYKSNRNTWFKRFERKIDAILRAYKLNPADYEK